MGGREVGGERRRRRHRSRRGRTAGRERRRRCPTVGVPRLRQRGRSSPVSQPALAPCRPWAPRGPAPGFVWRPPREQASGGNRPGLGGCRRRAAAWARLAQCRRGRGAGRGCALAGEGAQLAAAFPLPSRALRLLACLPVCLLAGRPGRTRFGGLSDQSRMPSSLSPWGPAVWKKHGGARETCELLVGEAERSGFYMKNECGWVGGGGREGDCSSSPASVQERKPRPTDADVKGNRGRDSTCSGALLRNVVVFVRGTSFGAPKSV